MSLETSVTPATAAATMPVLPGRPFKSTLALVVALGLAVLGVAHLLFFVLGAKLYLGRTLLEFDLSKESLTSGAILENYLGTQTGILGSRATAARVVNEQNLVKKWGLSDANQAIDRVLKMVKIRRIPKTALASVEVHSTSIEEAAELANAWARAYEERVKTMVMENASNIVNTLETELEHLEKKVEDKRVYLLTLQKKHFSAAAVSPAPGPTSEEKLRFNSLNSELQAAEKAFEQNSNFSYDLKQEIHEMKMKLILPIHAIRRHEEAYPRPIPVTDHLHHYLWWAFGLLVAGGLCFLRSLRRR